MGLLAGFWTQNGSRKTQNGRDQPDSRSMGFVMMKLHAVGMRAKAIGVRCGSRWNRREGDQDSQETESRRWVRCRADTRWKLSENFLASGWLLEWLDRVVRW